LKHFLSWIRCSTSSNQKRLIRQRMVLDLMYYQQPKYRQMIQTNSNRWMNQTLVLGSRCFQR
jgi:hypothetical protein